jgi:hypothetical protein
MKMKEQGNERKAKKVGRKVCDDAHGKKIGGIDM